MGEREVGENGRKSEREQGGVELLFQAINHRSSRYFSHEMTNSFSSRAEVTRPPSPYSSKNGWEGGEGRGKEE